MHPRSSRALAILLLCSLLLQTLPIPPATAQGLRANPDQTAPEATSAAEVVSGEASQPVISPSISSQTSPPLSPNSPVQTSPSNPSPTSFGNLPLSFIPNVGQFKDHQIRFVGRGSRAALTFRPDELHLALPVSLPEPDGLISSRQETRRAEEAVGLGEVRVRLEGADPTPEVSGTTHIKEINGNLRHDLNDILSFTSDRLPNGSILSNTDIVHRELWVAIPKGPSDKIYERQIKALIRFQERAWKKGVTVAIFTLP